ncbi:MAG: hypothetical protein IPL06_19840 [Betaproteobacteria bacterium]|nr:hypothetical protein [Betaproteobacteria bacterium]
MRTAFERWWSTSGEDSARDILAPRWIRLCRKHRRRAEPQILYRFFALLAEVEVGRVPSVPMTAALFRTVIRFPETEAWMELEALVRASSSPEALNSGWRFLHQRLQEGRARRHASRVTFDDAHDLLVRVAAALEGGSEPTLLRAAPDAGNAFTASTDGEAKSRSPAAIELTPTES